MLIWIPDKPFAIQNRWNGCWTPCSEDKSRIKSFTKNKRLILKLSTVILGRDLFLIFWGSYSDRLLDRTRSRGRCWTAIRLSGHSEFLRPCAQWRTTCSTACSSEPHSQTERGTTTHLQNQERRSSTPLRRRLSRTHTILGRVIPGDGCQLQG